MRLARGKNRTTDEAVDLAGSAGAEEVEVGYGADVPGVLTAAGAVAAAMAGAWAWLGRKGGGDGSASETLEVSRAAATEVTPSKSFSRAPLISPR